MPHTRVAPVVCSCRSRGCNKGRYLDKHGNWQSGGSIVTSMTRDNHMLVDARMEAMLQQDNDNVSDEDIDEPLAMQNQDHVDTDSLPGSDLGSEINLNGVTLNSRSPSPESMENLNVYDCRRFYDNSCLRVQPAVLHACLVAVILSIFEDTSVSTSSWFLKSARDLLTLTAFGIGESASKKLTHFKKSIIESIPKDIRTVIKWLNLDPVLIRVVCCPHCFAMYPYNSETPKKCIHISYSSGNEDNPTSTETQDKLNHSDDDSGNNSMNSHVCGAELFRPTINGMRPTKLYAFQNLYEWIGQMFSRNEIEDALESTAANSKKPYSPKFEASDIQHSRKWKEFMGPDQAQFTAQSGNLTFGIFLDGINPYGNRQAGKHASITFVIMVCYSLPVSLRYAPQNIFVVGIAPGPKEPSLEQINWILRPIVEQLKVLWKQGLYLSQTCRHPRGRRIFAAILPFFADLPALRRGLGFAAPTATRMCSCCLLPKASINNLEPQTWPRRTLADHKNWALASRDAPDQKTRNKILKEHGVRYSVMLELPYWDIVDNHVVDAMHNLLLGLLKWHCQRFWCMSDIADEEEPKGIPTVELLNLLADVAAPTSMPHREDSPTAAETESTIQESGIPFDYMDFPSHDTSDDSFSPYLGDGDWGGPWTAPSSDTVIFDRQALSFINKFLPRIRIPTWIKRAIPVLGKASFGRLKADEWRNLFTIQLPLILPIYWAAGGPSTRSLFQNFAHLVSLVNLALKRTMSSEKVNKYRYHNLEYLRSSLVLFPNVTLAPNHHMSIHLAESLEKFGPSRAWWSFSMERLMGMILKASHNNRLGQLEITFLINFCRYGNLEALMTEPEKFPPEFRHLLPQMRALKNPTPAETELVRKGPQSFLDLPTSKLLVARINELFPSSGGLEWILASEYSKMTKTQSTRFLSMNSSIEKLTDYANDGMIYSTFSKNPSNSLIKLKPMSKIEYGFIQKMFHHRRTLANQTCQTDMWLVVQPLAPGNFTSGNPFSKLDKFEMQLELKIASSKEMCLVHSSEIISNCAWVKYRALEISPSIKKECVGLVSLER